MLDFNKKKIIVIVGHPGSGKSSLGKMLLSNGIPKIISNTSRQIRHNDGEIDGVDYYFKTKESFTNRNMLEYSEVSGEYYGISWDEFYNKLTNYDVVYAIMEIQGALKLKELLGDRVDIRIVFIKADKNLCKERMIKRGDSIESIESRMLHIESYGEYTDCKYADCIIENGQELYYAYNELYTYISE